MKTNFLNKLKQGLFLLIAVLGTFVSYSQATTTTTIGGSKTPDTGGFIDIGGKGSNEPVLFSTLSTQTQCTFAIYNEPGGGKGTSSDTGQVDSPDDWDDIDTGGRGTNTGTGEFALGDTGGKNSTGGIENTCPLCPDTGGNGGKSTTGELMIADTGGRDSGGGLINQGSTSDIGGRNDTGTGQSPIAFCREFNSSSTNVAYFDSSEGENEPIPGCIFDTGGRNGTGTSTGGDFYKVEDTLSSDWTDNNGCVLRPFFPTD